MIRAWLEETPAASAAVARLHVSAAYAEPPLVAQGSHIKRGVRSHDLNWKIEAATDPLAENWMEAACRFCYLRSVTFAQCSLER